MPKPPPMSPLITRKSCGFAPNTAFRSTLAFHDRWCSPIRQREIDAVLAHGREMRAPGDERDIAAHLRKAGADQAADAA